MGSRLQTCKMHIQRIAKCFVHAFSTLSTFIMHPFDQLQAAAALKLAEYNNAKKQKAPPPKNKKTQYAVFNLLCRTAHVATTTPMLYNDRARLDAWLLSQMSPKFLPRLRRMAEIGHIAQYLLLLSTHPHPPHTVHPKPQSGHKGPFL